MADVTLPGRSAAVRAQCRASDDHAGDPAADGSEAPEGILDAIVTSLIALHDLQRARAATATAAPARSTS